jgi:hypothetical protein
VRIEQASPSAPRIERHRASEPAGVRDVLRAAFAAR